MNRYRCLDYLKMTWIGFVLRVKKGDNRGGVGVLPPPSFFLRLVVQVLTPHYTSWGSQLPHTPSIVTFFSLSIQKQSMSSPNNPSKDIDSFKYPLSLFLLRI